MCAACDAKTWYVTPDGIGPAYLADREEPVADTVGFAQAAASAMPGDVIQLASTSSDPKFVTVFRSRLRLLFRGRAGEPPVTVRGLGSRTTLRGSTVAELRKCEPPEDDRPKPCESSGMKSPSLAEGDGRDLLAILTSAGSAPPYPEVLPGTLGMNPFGEAALAEAACLDVDHSDGVVVERIRFEDCWMAAVRATNSHRVTLRDALIVGSSYGLAMKGSPTRPGADGAREVTVEDVTWIQDPSGFATLDWSATNRCLDGATTRLGCPGDMWRKIPWGSSHHGTYEHFNGGLLGGYDLTGEIVFRHNRILSAFNGIRLKAKACAELPTETLDRATCPYNDHVWIYGNTFSYIRDNPVELEVWATNVMISGNEIHDAHAWFSFDDMGGGPVYVYGNRGWFDDMPVADRRHPGDSAFCLRRPADAVQKPQGSFDKTYDRRFDYALGAWLPVGAEAWDPDEPTDYDWMDPLDQVCDPGLAGRVIKLQLPSKGVVGPAFRFAEAGPIYVFNNSWYLRSPVTATGAASNLRHWNNAILFCKADQPGYDARLCAPNPATFEPAMCGREFLRTDDLRRYVAPGGGPPFFDCFRWLPYDQQANDAWRLESDFDHDVSSVGFPVILTRRPFEPNGVTADPGFRDPAHGDLRLGEGSPAGTSTCLVVFESDTLKCASAPVGAAYAGAYALDGTPYGGPDNPVFRKPE